MPLRAFLIAVCLCLKPGIVFADGDAAAGKGVFGKCASCHMATEPFNRVGPSLMGVVGRPVATARDYSYSDAMAAFGEDGKVWDEARLAEYLFSPKAMVKGTKMTFAGLRKPADIANVIAYLKTTATAK